MKDPFGIGTKLRKLRDFHHLTQEYVATQLGVAQNTYSQYENGTLQIDREKLEKAAQLYKVDVNVFFSSEPLSFHIGTQNGSSGYNVTHNQNDLNKELMDRMWKHMEERSRSFEEMHSKALDLYGKALDLFERMAQAKK